MLAGDHLLACAAWRGAKQKFLATPIIYVAGNHEFYGGQMRQVTAALREAADCPASTCSMWMNWLGGARFLGATLWTDFVFTVPAWAHPLNECGEAGGQRDFRMIRDCNTEFFHPELAREGTRRKEVREGTV